LPVTGPAPEDTLLDMSVRYVPAAEAPVASHEHTPHVRCASPPSRVCRVIWRSRLSLGFTGFPLHRYPHASAPRVHL